VKISTLLSIAAAVVAALLALTPPALEAQNAKAKAKAKGPSGPAPRFQDGTPDLSGVWTGGGPGNLVRALKPGDSINMLPWAEKVLKERQSKDDPEANCLPAGIPRMAPYPWKILQTPTHYFIIYEGNIHSYRQIFVDGRKHPEDPNPTWYGHSIGHWEGDTLVVDTVGFNDRFWFDFDGHPHTEQLHIVERYRRTDLGTLSMEILIDDPGAYAKPFTLLTTARLLPGAELMEYICQENNTNVEHIQGPARTP
jgi:hypothetical protein